MTSYIKSVRAYGLYENFSLEQAFTSGVNILYGPNGSGKTTLLHILANTLTGDFNRFAFLPFSTIQIDLDDIIVRLRRTKVRDEYSTQIDDTITIELGDSQEPYRITASELEQYGTTSFAGHTKTESSWPNRSTNKQTLNIAYLPAYRNVVDAWKLNELSKEGCTVNEVFDQ